MQYFMDGLACLSGDRITKLKKTAERCQFEI